MNAVREVDGAVTAVERAIRGVQAPPSGIVRVTSTDTFCIAVLPGVISGFHSQEGAIQIELIATSEYLDLSRLGADIAVRPTPHWKAKLSPSWALTSSPLQACQKIAGWRQPAR